MQHPERSHAIIRMYAPHEKIYVREVHGRFTRLRWLCVWLTQVVYYGLPWLTWNGRPAVLFDLAARKFYLFGIVLWPQDFIYLAAMLVLCACLLFLLSAIAGRVWCGLACPHTVYTEIFMWIERRIEGNRSARLRLDKQLMSPAKFARKAAKHTAWIAVAAWTGITLVAYFTPARVLLHEIAAFDIGPWQAFWMLFYSGFAYMNAGWMREQICQYLCAYARFQSVMFDRDTLLITYDEQRGEPRGVRRTWRAGAGPKLGDCIDCKLCVQVCPAGIDIRDGLQFECIDCAACVDACDGVMDKVGAPRGLIRYATENALREGLSLKEVRRRIARPRVLAYAGILVTALALTFGSLAFRTPLKLDVILDRSVMGRVTDDGMVENVYRLQLMNTDERAHRFRLSVSGMDSLQVEPAAGIEAGPAAAQTFAVRVRTVQGRGSPGANRIKFELTADDSSSLHLSEPAVFYIPGLQ
ncbi:cytochrome c oxidase accessory protein CcoG [Noviherbaspirillum denitrificans]|uniref:Cytochrome c oxidase accessory protein CcoG n=1 Tax=Noviherbaspirillum denitrificans TaxID=1968433 RepID=A0A254TGL1_9BURK|nr:cytochrome c oxidase accessory protein CcoG [Noviherbaspirillum denitrificans]OWW21770.1 cytochrome c oxidase accessory protein CcoG [Noviherbaspirillum denitrificans]